MVMSFDMELGELNNTNSKVFRVPSTRHCTHFQALLLAVYRGTRVA